jgi:hypothetical protein
MSWLLATYGRGLPPHATWNWWPLVGIVLVVGGVLAAGRPLTLWVAASAVAFGPVFATAVHAWGAPVAVATGLFALVTVALLRPQPR